MRFKCHSGPIHRQTRTIKKFAWFPTHIIEEDCMVWFEYYYAAQTYYSFENWSGWETKYSWLDEKI